MKRPLLGSLEKHRLTFLLFFMLNGVSTVLTGCFFDDFFSAKPTTDSGAKSGATGQVFGNDLGEKAGSVDEDALTAIYAVTTEIPPAAIRPDPDTYIRSLLRQYREEGITIARKIGEVEAYRALLGGANQDFSVEPQEGYDSTSLLAAIKVAEEICEGLVAPDSERHSGWTTILPANASDVDTNLEFLAQRFMGLPSAEIPSDALSELEGFLQQDFELSGAQELSEEHYIGVCTLLAIDAEAALL